MRAGRSRLQPGLKRVIAFPARLLLLLALASPALGDPGRLVIVGGGLAPDNAAVYRAFIDSLPATGRVVVIPAASAYPADSGQSAGERFAAHGLAPERTVLFPVAVRDDDTTADVDESRWRANAWDEEQVASLGEPAGFWFTGGDQSRIIETLVGEDDTPSPLLKLIRQRLAAGATVGGTSAGAAVMSDPMIAGGQSFEALTGASPANSDGDGEDGRLLLSPGLGFLPGALVDQHFGERARLGRLVRALAETGAGTAYGIDEDTALVVDLEQGEARVLGSGAVTVLHAGSAGFDTKGPALATGLVVGVAAHGATFPLGECRLGGAVGNSTLPSPYYDAPVAGGGGMAFGSPSLGELLGSELLDNRQGRRLVRYSLHEDGRLLSYSFTQGRGSTGYWTDEGGPGRYSVCGVAFDVTRGRWKRLD